MTLQEFFNTHPKVAIAFSGGVDSSYLLFSALKYAKEVKAYYIKSAFQPQFEYEDALTLAQSLNAPLSVVEADILSQEDVVKNPSNRCYYCKKTLFSLILNLAQNDGFTTIIEGTNASDDIDDRPGYKALGEMQVLSPLKLCGLTKERIRELSKEACLFTYNKPSYACLATRIKTGQALTLGNLKQTERAESALHALGFEDFRVRMDGNTAKLELKLHDFERVLNLRAEVLNALKDYDQVLLNLNPRG